MASINIIVPNYSMQGNKTSVHFVLSGNLASSAPRQLHKCELSIKIKTVPDLQSNIIQPPLCHKFVETFYGAFMDVCDYESKY